MPMSPALAAQRTRQEAGWLFATSFRPFFLGASLQAALTVPVWVWMLQAGTGEVGGMPALVWHAHEMVFGFLPAVMAGYLLSATPNWTGRLPVSGWPLATLFALWVAGRIAPLAVPPVAGAAVDAAFPLAVAALFLREARAKRGGQSRHGLMLFPLLAAATVAHRLMAADYEAAALLSRLGIAVGALMIAAVGGRLVPSLTRNALARADAARVPEPYGRFDVAVLLVASAGLAAWVAAPLVAASSLLLATSAVLHLARLLRWRGWLLREGPVVALHAGYLWLAVGTGAAALAGAPFFLLPPDAALHAFSAGAIGTMTISVMARLSATRGSGAVAGRRRAGAAILLVNLGAALRVAAPAVPGLYMPLLAGGAVSWSAGFALFALAHLPISGLRGAPVSDEEAADSLRRTSQTVPQRHEKAMKPAGDAGAAGISRGPS